MVLLMGAEGEEGVIRGLLIVMQCWRGFAFSRQIWRARCPPRTSSCRSWLSGRLQLKVQFHNLTVSRHSLDRSSPSTHASQHNRNNSLDSDNENNIRNIFLILSYIQWPIRNSQQHNKNYMHFLHPFSTK